MPVAPPVMLRLICLVTGDEVDVSESYTTIMIFPEPVLLWPCPKCDGIHANALDVNSFDALSAAGYSIWGALGGP